MYCTMYMYCIMYTVVSHPNRIKQSSLTSRSYNQNGRSARGLHELDVLSEMRLLQASHGQAYH